MSRRGTYYRLTAKGKRVLKAEQERLADLLAVAARRPNGGKEGERMSAERFYSLLVRAYPERFRVRFEDGMRDAFRRDHAAARDGDSRCSPASGR